MFLREMAETPTEKASRWGLNTLSDAEVLSIIIGGQNSLRIAHCLLKTFVSLNDIQEASSQELQKIVGLGKIGALKVLAALNISRRVISSSLKPGVLLAGSRQVFNHYRHTLGMEEKEHFYALLLNSKHKIISEELISVGSLNMSICHPRELFSVAIRKLAESIILVHNHPSQEPEPSREDLSVTHRMVEVGKMVGIEILDHLIVCRESYISLAEQHLLGN